MKQLLRRLAYNYSEGGLSLIARKGAGYIWSQTEWHIYVSRGAVDLPNDYIDRAYPQSVKWRQLSSGDLALTGYFKAFEFPEEIDRRFTLGNACHGFYLDDRLATVGWSSDDYLELDRGVVFHCPSEVGLFDFFTLPEFRSRGLYTHALRQLLAWMRDRGTPAVYIAADPGNRPSLRGIMRAGFRQHSAITRRRRFGIGATTSVALDL